jgi:Protein of unknown function (DUF3500)
MNEPTRTTPPTPKSRGRNALPMLAAVLFVCVGLYASRSALAPAPAAGTEEPKEKKPLAPSPRAVAVADAFLDSLDAKQRDKAVYEFASEKKSNWSNLPVSFVPRNGVRLGDLTKEQRAKAMDVVAAVLSKDGYQKVVDIMAGDQKLADGGGGKGKGPKGGGKGGGPAFGVDEYFLAIFGKPSETRPWMVQFGGHHLGVNVTVVGKHFILTPTHTGAQPALFKRGDQEVRPLGLEADTAFKLVNALDDKQRAQAIIGDRPQGELLLGPGRDGKTIEPKGIKGSALTADQRTMLLDVIAAWVNIVEADAAAARMAAIKEKIADTYFAWSGPTEKGKAAYFRVQGPAVVIEYAPQGGTDHIHTVIRNPEDDYGASLLKQ